MRDPTHALIESIHASPTRAALAVTGGGSRALSWLLTVPGASATVLEATVPYAAAALKAYVGQEVEHHVSEETAALMARAALKRARRWAGEDESVIGLAGTAALASNRTKKGEHRAYAALAEGGSVRTWRLRLDKGRRSRDEEEELLAELLIQILALSAGVVGEVRLELQPGDELCPPPSG